MIDLTYIVLKDVIVTSLTFEDMRKEVLGKVSLDKKSVNETIGFIEAKEIGNETICY